jgi:hypothetical protein
MRKALNGQGLQPDAAWTSERCEKNPVTSEDHVSYSRDALNLKRNVGVEGSDVAGVHAESFAGCEVFDDDFTGEFKPRRSLTVNFLQKEAIATEDSCSKRLLKADAECDASSGTEKAMAMNHVLMPVRYFNRDDVARDAGRKSNLPGSAISAVLGHEESAAAGDALESTEKTSPAGMLRVSCHLYGLAHPGEFASLGDDGVIVIERELENRHGCADDAMLHVRFSP